MFLKRLDVIGFKSFAQRVTWTLLKGSQLWLDQTGAAKVILPMLSAGYLENNQRKASAEEKWKISFLQEVTQEKESI